ncbi:FAD-binding oxidoreductase [Reyranella sp.]|uniref:FAD-binding oxidoreductase n=1 Tax=Reyranella sp. TaxID=1929291 RepID=UPI003D0BFFAB
MIDPDFKAVLDGLELVDQPVLLRQRSRDFYWYSPILKRELDGKAAELIVVPHSVDEVVRVAAACARFRVPLGVRGGATGNYGQMVPLQGGVLLDMARLDRTLWIDKGRGRFEAGVKLADADTLAQQQGWELRMFPSTRRQATVGGYVSGGAAGVGSIRYGQLRDAGSVLALKVVTCEETPRIVELRGADIGKALHAYGTSGIVVEVELPLAPAYAWVEMIATFDDFAVAAHFAQALGESDGIFLKLDSLMAWPLPRYFMGFEDGALPEGKHVVFIMVAASDAGAVRCLVAERGGTVTLDRPYREERGQVPLYEYTWNHTTLQVLKIDKTVSYLQTVFPIDANIDALIASHERFGEEVMAHAEFQRRQGRTNCSSLQVLRYTTDERLWQIVAELETLGIRLSNPHSYILEDKGARVLSADLQLEFKRESDPYGLLNPGKMSRWQAA